MYVATSCFKAETLALQQMEAVKRVFKTLKNQMKEIPPHSFVGLLVMYLIASRFTECLVRSQSLNKPSIISDLHLNR